MQDIVNGAIYAVDLEGTEAYEFSGVHPTIIIRTLKEQDVYWVIPLTTYSKDKWEKCKRKGFGCRIMTTNSIARVDKIKIISKKQIKKPYYSNKSILYASAEELASVIDKTNQYLNLSGTKTLKEFNKFLEQKEEYRKIIDDLFKNKIRDDSILTEYINNSVIITHSKSLVSFLNINDVMNIFHQIIENNSTDISIENGNIRAVIKDIKCVDTLKEMC